MALLKPKFRFLLFSDLGLVAAVVLFLAGLLHPDRYADFMFYAFASAYGGVLLGTVTSGYWQILLWIGIGIALGLVPYLDYAGHRIDQGLVVFSWIMFGVISTLILVGLMGAHMTEDDFRPYPRPT